MCGLDEHLCYVEETNKDVSKLVSTGDSFSPLNSYINHMQAKFFFTSTNKGLTLIILWLQ